MPRPACPYCRARLLMPLDLVTAVVRALGRATAARTWFVCVGCYSSVALTTRSDKE
jgi:hypothetical protein